MAGALTISTLNNDTGVLATQNGMTGIPKAWCQFTMGTSGTAITINGSFNISSVTYVSTGFMTANFTTAMPSANYSVVGCGSINQATTDWTAFYAFSQSTSPFYAAPTTSSFGMAFVRVGSGNQNPVYGNFAVFSS